MNGLSAKSIKIGMILIVVTVVAPISIYLLLENPLMLDIFLGVVSGIAGISIGILLFLFALPLIPTMIERLSNKPNRFRRGDSVNKDYPVSEFGFFTSLAPGQVKIIEAGDVFVRCIMKYPGHTFAGETDEYVATGPAWDSWEVKETPPGKSDTHPIPRLEKASLFGIAIWVWARWVYKITGYVFIGVYPYRKVRTYTMKRYKKVIGSTKLIEFEDYSDHLRVADFEFPVIVPEADTQDKAQVFVSITPIAQIRNPFIAAYNTNDWASRVTSAVTDGVTDYTRTHMLDDVLSASKGGEKNNFAKTILQIGTTDGTNDDTVLVIGVGFKQVLVQDISVTESNDPTKRRLADVAFARIDREAQEERAKGAAAQLREQITVVKDGGHVGLAVLAAERNVRTAQAAGEKAIVVVGGSGETDPLQAAMLQELRDINLRNTLSGKE